MRRFLTLTLALLMLAVTPAPLIAQHPAPKAQTQTKDQTVYITKAGTACSESCHAAMPIPK